MSRKPETDAVNETPGEAAPVINSIDINQSHPAPAAPSTRSRVIGTNARTGEEVLEEVPEVVIVEEPAPPRPKFRVIGTNAQTGEEVVEAVPEEG